MRKLSYCFVFMGGMLVPTVVFAENANLSLQSQAIKLDTIITSMQNRMDALDTELQNTKTELQTVKTDLNDCSATKGIYDPGRRVCKDLVYKEITRKHVLTASKCKARDCNAQAAFDVEEFVPDEAIALHAYIRWGGCGGNSAPEYTKIDLENPGEQSVNVYYGATRSGKHGSYVKATYNPSAKTIRFDYGAWGDGLWCGSKGDGWNRHYINERGIQVITPEIIEVERPVNE